jgi:CMP-N,N'-diacetyllegionaminic acid synthase
VSLDDVLGIVPARGGSKGIPRKNLALVAGRPLLAYTLDEARHSRRLDRVVLSTDDAEIAAFGRSGGVEVPFLRPAELASDAASVDAVVAHTLDWLLHADGYEPDAFVILHPTTPLRTATHIDEAIEALASCSADAVVGVSPPMEHPSDMVFFEEGRLRFLLPDAGYLAGVQRQGYPHCYFLNGAIYVTRTPAFHHTGTRFGRTTAPYVMDPLDSIDIDTTADLALAELLLQRRRPADAAARA